MSGVRGCASPISAVLVEDNAKVPDVIH
jgi:hypothetical protein